MKKYSVLSVGLLVFMLTLGGMAYGEGSTGGSTSGSGSSQSSGSGAMGSDQGMGGTGGSSGSAGGMGSESYGSSPSAGQMQGQVDINTATAKELEKVPGMSRSMAKNIVKYRDQNGPFASVDDLSKVKGINEQKLNQLRSSLTVGAAGSQQQPMGGSQGGTSGMGTGSEGAGGTSGGTGSGDMGGTGTDTSDGMGSGGTSGSGSSGDMGTGGTSGSGSGSGMGTGGSNY